MRYIQLKPSAFSVATLRKQKGMTIIEIMVAMVIMMVVLAAILLNVSSSTKSGRLQQSLSQMMEDGQIALNTIARGVRNAGYEEFTEVPDPLKDRPRLRNSVTLLDSPYLLGCQGANVSTTVSSSVADWGAACPAVGTGSDSIALRYQGGQLQQIPVGSVSATDLDPRDCSGEEVTGSANELTRADGSTIMIVDNRFYISGNTLMCWGNGKNGATELVSNIVQMKLWYGVAERVKDSGGFVTTAKVTSGYMTASQVASSFPNETVSGTEGYDRWNRVTSVRVCVLVRSREPVSSAPSFDYTDCDGVAQPDPGTGYLHRAMFTTVEIPNVGAGF
ncbi:PilW family protein [Saezia sanguinis]|uniref:PilW family protein n=1 Tax=Saezia sanguinis TaxID=1965230 RepID=UPI003064BB50